MKDHYLKNELYEMVNSDTSIFEFIQSGSLDGIWYWDLENPEIEWMSPKFWETLGYNHDEKKHLASEWQDIIFQEDLILAIENLEKHCIDPNHPYDQIVRYKHKGGSTVWIRCRGLAIRDDNGKAIRMLGAHTDITDLKEAEKKISRLTKEYEKVFNNTQDAIFLIKVLDNGEFRYVRNNLAHQNKTGILLEQIIDKSPQELLGKEMGDVVVNNYRKCLVNKKGITYEEELSLPGGNRIWLTALTPVVEDNKVSHIVGSATDITERKKLEIELEKHANYDRLTGLPNRKLFFERLERLIIENERDNAHFALLFIDLDGFKDINDNYGHEAGDEVLITVAKRIQKCIRKPDTAARMGGDEFTVILRNIENRKVIDTLAKKIHKALEEVMHIGDHTCYVSSSIGIAIYPDNGRDSETLLRNADSTMYKVKRNGKGGIEFS
ncbi:histidinol-phosphatase (PHP family) [Desulfitispora alkaliphila]|uniref:diguanylate cyclase domain-containing protein n=1 Tax=Desulfitispora alkaliphila TaxID=622674 RepID=UPI003D20AAC7